MTGKAHEFYIRKVSSDPYRWNLHDFFLELFNSCFPVDFRSKQRRKLAECSQRGRTVREYVSELYEFWNLIGDVSEREKVTRLWNGFQHWLQSELWKDKLNSEKSTLSEVVAAAEVLEIAHSVGGGSERHFHKGKDKSLSFNRSSDNPPRASDGGGKDGENSSTGNNQQHFGKRKPVTKPRAGKQLTSRMKLSKEEHDHAVENKLCFICKKSGHFANACPDTCTIQGGSSSKPPGVSSFSVHVTPDIEQLRALADTTESLDQLELGTCELMLESFMLEEDDSRHRKMGDPLARRAEHVLAMSALFPEDNTDTLETYRHDRFTVYRISKYEHIICDNARLSDRPNGT